MAEREKIRLVWRKIDELIPYEHNAKLHPAEQIDKLVRSFDEFGRIVPAGIDKAGNLIYGHGRILAARQRGDTEFPCIVIDGLSETQRRAFVHADNLLSETGTDAEILRAEMQALQAAGFDVTLTGYDDSQLVISPPSEIIEDDADLLLPENPRTSAGQLWQLGDHILRCGDATSAKDVQACTGGGQIDLLLTDPPYGVDYTVTARGVKKRPIANDDKKGPELRSFLRAAFEVCAPVLSPGAPFYVFGPPGPNQEEFYAALRESGLPVHQLLIWVKPQLVLGRSDYQNRHEVCISGEMPHDVDNLPRYEGFDSAAYGWKPGAAHLWRSDRKQTTVLEFDKPARSDQHPTMKPIKLLAYLLQNSTLPGAMVLDPFGGSGSTLIACEQLGRKCRMLEIDPHYCDVIIDRWEAFTGKKAVLLDG